jgi:hypothetical protein
MGEWGYNSTFLDEGELLASGSGRFISGERSSGTDWIGGSVDLISGMDGKEKKEFCPCPGIEPRPSSP